MSEDNNLIGDKFLDTVELRGMSILKGASQILSKEFFQFIKINVIITVAFLLILFFFINNYGDIIADSVVSVVKDLYIHKTISYSSIASLMIILLFWIFFSWLRASYVAAGYGYFAKTNPLSTGLIKLISFLMVELVRLVVFFIGIILLPFLPFFITRYYLAPSIVVVQNEGGINAMFESKEYTDGRIVKTMFCAFFINVFILATVVSCVLITNLLIKDRLIFYSLNILLFTFLFMPLHSCSRLLLFKKLEQLDGELRVKISAARKFWFIFLRLALIIVMFVAAFILLEGRFVEFFDGALWFMLQLMAN